MKELAEKLKELSPEQIKQLSQELHQSSVVVSQCPQGYYYDSTTQSCILDAGPGA